ncbi:SPOR domain-containing protein [Paenibacillus sp. FSL M8-0334]|uniref:SPOR domain-containing protein n=1 Tax=Paenibacillus sp. FSL M8-0334 TaxID=2921623 RepID=UPI0030F63701
MNKARMTIRFDHGTPKERNKDHDEFTEEYLQPVPKSVPQAGIDWLQPVGWPDKPPEDNDADEWSGNAYTGRRNGRLAEERRRMAEADRSPVDISGSRYDEYWHDEWDESRYDEITDASHPMDRSGHHAPPILLPEDSSEQDGRSTAFQEDSPLSTEDYGYYRKRNPTSFWKMTAAVMGAVMTGVIFGYAVLSFFESGRIEEAPGRDTTIQGEVAPSSAAGPDNPIGDETAAGPDTGGTAGEQSGQTPGIPPAEQTAGQTFYMLQYGVFSTPERAEQAKQELLQAGIAAGGDPDEENRVYAGISPDREQAKLLSNQLKSEGVELYVREMTVPGAASAVFAGELPNGEAYFESGGQLVAELSALSATLLGQSEPTVVEAGVMDRITQLHQQWIMASGSMSAGAGPEAGELMHRMEQAMNSAIMALSEYNKNRSKGHLWEIQTGMMDYVMGQKRLLHAL